jgi:hypothetical protein
MRAAVSAARYAFSRHARQRCSLPRFAASEAERSAAAAPIRLMLSLMLASAARLPAPLRRRFCQRQRLFLLFIAASLRRLCYRWRYAALLPMTLTPRRHLISRFASFDAAAAPFRQPPLMPRLPFTDCRRRYIAFFGIAVISFSRLPPDAAITCRAQMPRYAHFL